MRSIYARQEDVERTLGCDPRDFLTYVRALVAELFLQGLVISVF